MDRGRPARRVSRFGVAVMSAAVVWSSLLAPSPLAAVTPSPASSPAPSSPPPTPGRASSSAVSPAHPAPIGSHATDDAAHAPGVSDAHLRPTFAPYVPPSAPTEVPGLRSEHRSVVANPDGSYTASLSAGRLNYPDAQGRWQPLDLGLLPMAGGAFDLQVAASDRTIRLGDRNASAGLASVAADGNTVALRALGYAAADPRAAGSNRLTFPGVGSAGSVFAQPTDTGFEFGVSLAAADRAAVYDFALDPGGLAATLDSDGSAILLTSSASGAPVTVGRIGAAALLDANGTLAKPGAVSLSLIRPGAPSLPAGVPAADLAALASGEVLLSYAIEPSWLQDAARAFPVTLDPTVCIAAGVSGCSGGAFDYFIESGLPNNYPVGWNVTRVGYDTRGWGYAAMRGLQYFPDVSLGDGAEVVSASLALQVASEYGPAPRTPTMSAYRVTGPWTEGTETWNQFGAGGDYVTANASPALAIPAVGGVMAFDVTAITRQFYTRRAANWLPNIGFLLKESAESASYGDVEFHRYNDATLSSRPKLTINYVVPRVQFDFDPALGANYAPTRMTAGQTAKLPLNITNNGSGYTFGVSASADNYRLGYRWFDAKGALVSSAVTAIAGQSIVSGGTTSVLQKLNVAAPSANGQYTLRLDLVHTINTVDLWASDWAAPSLYYSRDKRVLSTDNTRWTGSSLVERDEFSIAVVDGSGTAAGQMTSLPLGPDGTLAANLDSGNWHFEGSGGVGFNDLQPVGLRYGYDSVHGGACNTAAYNGVLGACGWYTNFDERLTPAGAGSYTYQAPSGNQALVSTDGQGQLLSGAPLLLERPRVTFIDENGSGDANGDGIPDVRAVNAQGSYAIPAYAGVDVVRTASQTSTFIPGTPLVELRAYRYVSFAARSSAAAATGIDFKIHNASNPSVADRWLIYTLGPNFATGFDQIALGGTLLNAWDAVNRRDLYSDALNTGKLGAWGDALQVVGMQTTSNGTAGNLFIDAVRFDGLRSGVFDDAPPAWTSSGVTVSQSSDHISGSYALKVPSASLASSPSCNQSSGCVYGGLLSDNPFMSWWWRKVAGASIAVKLSARDTRTGAIKALVYYAGSEPAGVPTNCGPSQNQHCSIQVDDHLPGDWTQVTRNVLSDARQMLGFYNDNPSGSSPSAPPSQGPIADLLTLDGYVISAPDGRYALFDAMTFSSLPNVGSEQLGHPSSLGDATLTYDYVATYSDGSRHFFNGDGLLQRITDLDGNATVLDWGLSSAAVGQLAWTLKTVHAPSDGLLNGSTTAQRELVVSRTPGSGGAHTKITFSESLGSSAAGGQTGRQTAFYVATAASSGDPQYGVGDLVYVSPARNPAGSNCVRASAATGCLEYSYTMTSGHYLWKVSDPRRSSSNSYWWQLNYSGVQAARLTDASRGGVLLQILSYDANPTANYVRPVYQDAAALAANAALAADLTFEGQLLNAYVRRPCSGSCSSAIPSWTSADYAETHQFDGLAHTNQLTRYRCPATPNLISGCTASSALASITRQGSQAAAKIDNLNDPLRAGELAWTQNADQYVASQAAGNPDAYTTSYTYDTNHRVTHQLAAVFNRLGSYPQPDLHTSYDREGHPIAVDDNTFVRNPGFEDGTTGWTLSAGSAAIDPGTAQSGDQSLKLAAAVQSNEFQAVQLLPGQTFRLQLAWKASPSATYAVYYQRASDSAFYLIPGAQASTSASSWATTAADVTLPLDGTGLLRVYLTAPANGSAWFDEVTILTAWQQTSYLANGLPSDRLTLDPTSPSGTLDQRLTYVAAGAGTTYLPAIFPTSRIDHYLDGSPGPDPDQDVTSTTRFDPWGRAIGSTDPDGVTSTTSYAADPTRNGFASDLASSADGLGNLTSYTYDLVGNQLSVTAPAGEQTATSYDLAGHGVLVSAPDGTRRSDGYDVYGRLTSSIANYLDGTPSAASASDDVVSSYTYDAFGNRTRSVLDDGAFSGAIQQQTDQTFDLFGNLVASSVYPGAGQTGSPRTTTNYFETVAGGVTRAAPSGSRLPIAPSASPAPLCPGSSATYCNTVSTLDLRGQPVLSTDSYGKRSAIDRDLAGQPVRSIANYLDGVYDPALTDTDVTSQLAYDIVGRLARATDPAGRLTTTSYDALGRATLSVYGDTSGALVSQRKTLYTPAGRVDRASALGAYGLADTALTWTKIEYDPAGRAIRSLAHFDIGGTPPNFHQRIDSFETGAAGWSSAASGGFTTAPAAAMGLDDDYAAVGPSSGRSRLRLTTSSSVGGDGAWLDLSGQTFQAGRRYHLHAELRAASGTDLSVLLGVDASGGSNAQQTISSSGGWQAVDLDWTPALAVSSSVHLALRKDTAGGVDVYLDNVSLYDTAQPDWNIPSQTAYDADGRVLASVLPPAAAGGAPLVTSTAYDPAGRSVAVSVNATDSYSHQIVADGGSNGLVGYWPLDERGGSSAADHAGSDPGTYNGGYRLGLAGAPDEARTAAHLDGASASDVSVPDAASLDLGTALSVELWASSDTLLGPASAAGTDFGGVSKAGAYGLGWTTKLSGGGWRFAITAGGTEYDVDASAVVEPHRWYHLLGTYDGSLLRLYVDGSLLASSSIGAKTIDNVTSPLRIGSFGGGQWTGSLDEVALYRQALSAGAVSAHFAAGRASASDVRLTTRTDYDALGHPSLDSDPRGVRRLLSFDRLGRISSTTANYLDGVSSGSADDVRTSFAYDALGEQIGMCSANQVSATGCDPAAAANPQAWHSAYDAMGHLASQVPPVNTSAAPLDSTSWTYDAGGRLTTSCSFAAGGSCSSATERHVDFSYDGTGRLVSQKTYAGAGLAALQLSTTTTYTVDAAPASIDADYSGAGEGNPAPLSLIYDAMGQPDQVKSGSTVLTDYAWNADGTLASRSDAAGGALGTTTFGYDWAKRVASLANPTLVSGSLGSTWNLDGSLAGRSWPNGESASFSYDAAKRPSAATYLAAGSFAQTYDRAGNVTSDSRSLAGVAGDAGSGTASYTYDALRRLTGSSGVGGTRAYTYDRDGNRLSRSEPGISASYSYDRADQLTGQVLNGTPGAFTYDGRGNLTSAATSAMTQTSTTYDLGERLSAITPASGSPASFSFDSLGRHASRTVGSATDTYSYLGSTSTLVGISTAGVMTASLLDPTGSRLANRNMSSAAATFSLPDLHGSLAAAQLTGSTSIADAYRYDGYGQTIASGGSHSGPAQPYRYQGRLDVSPDAAEPLYDFGARAYQPSLGVFTQLDSLAGSVQDPLSLNRYLYAEANPTSLIDPDGHAAISGADLEGSDRTYYSTTPAKPGQPPTTVEHDIWAPRLQPIPPHWQQGADLDASPGGTNGLTLSFAPPRGTIASSDQLSAMTIGELKAYLIDREKSCGGPGAWAGSCADYLVGMCLYGNAFGAGGDCNAYAGARAWSDLDGPAFDFVVAPAIAAGAYWLTGALAQEVEAHPEIFDQVPQITRNAIQGRQFQDSVLKFLRVPENFMKFGAKPGMNVIPDALLNGITEVKNVQAISRTSQLEGMFNVATDAKLPFNLIVSPSTTYISTTVQRFVLSTGGTIMRFDPLTQKLTPWP